MESNNKGLLFGSNTHNTDKELFAQKEDQSRYTASDDQNRERDTDGVLPQVDNDDANNRDEQYENSNPGGAGSSGSAATNEEGDHTIEH